MEDSAEVEMKTQNEEHDQGSLTFDPTQTVFLGQFVTEDDDMADKAALDLSMKKPSPSNHVAPPLVTPTNQDISTHCHGNPTIARGNQVHVQPSYKGAFNESPPVIHLGASATPSSGMPIADNRSGSNNNSLSRVNRTSEPRQDAAKGVMQIPPGAFQENNDMAASGNHDGGFVRNAPHSKDGKCARVAPQIRGPGAVAMETAQGVTTDLTHHLLPVSSRQAKWAPIAIGNHPQRWPTGNAGVMETSHSMVSMETSHSKAGHVAIGHHRGGTSPVTWQSTGRVNMLPKSVVSQPRFEPRSQQEGSESQGSVPFATAEPYSSLHLNLLFIDRTKLSNPKDEELSDVCGFVSEELHENSSEILHYYCSFCSYKTTDQETFTEHILVHMFVCKYCGYLTYSRFFHLLHLQQCHPHLGYNIKNYRVCKVQISASPEQEPQEVVEPMHDGGFYTDEDAVVPVRGTIGRAETPRDHPNGPVLSGHTKSNTATTILREQSCQTDDNNDSRQDDNDYIPRENFLHPHWEAAGSGQQSRSCSTSPLRPVGSLVTSYHSHQTTSNRGTPILSPRQDSRMNTATSNNDNLKTTLNMSGGSIIPKQEGGLRSCQGHAPLSSLPRTQSFQTPQNFSGRNSTGHQDGKLNFVHGRKTGLEDERTPSIGNDKESRMHEQRDGSPFSSTSVHMVYKPQIQSGGAVLESRSHTAISQPETRAIRYMNTATPEDKSMKLSPPLAHQNSSKSFQQGHENERGLLLPPPAHSHPPPPSSSVSQSFTSRQRSSAVVQSSMATDNRGQWCPTAAMTGQGSSSAVQHHQASSVQTFHQHHQQGLSTDGAPGTIMKRGAVVSNTSGHLATFCGTGQQQHQVPSYLTPALPSSSSASGIYRPVHTLQPPPPPRPAAMATTSTFIPRMPGMPVGMVPVVNPKSIHPPPQFRMRHPQPQAVTTVHSASQSPGSKTVPSTNSDKKNDISSPIKVKREPQDVVELEDGVLDLSIKDKTAPKVASFQAVTTPTLPSSGSSQNTTLPPSGSSQNATLPSGMHFLPAPSVTSFNMLPAQGAMFPFPQQPMLRMHPFMAAPVNPAYPMLPGNINPSVPGTFNPSHLMMPGPINPSVPATTHPSMPGTANSLLPGSFNPSLPGTVNPSVPTLPGVPQVSRRTLTGGSITLVPGSGPAWTPQSSPSKPIDSEKGQTEENMEQRDRPQAEKPSERQTDGQTEPMDHNLSAPGPQAAAEEDPAVQNAAEIILNLGKDKMMPRPGEQVRKRPGQGVDIGQFTVKRKKGKMNYEEEFYSGSASQNSSPAPEHRHDNRMLFRSYSDSGHFRNQDDPPPLLTPGTPQESHHPNDTPPRLFSALADPATTARRGPGRPPKYLRTEGGDSDQGSPGAEGKIYAKRGPKPGHCTRGPLLWQFIRDLLKNPTYCPRIIKWENQKDGVFRIIHSEEVAKLWGRKKSNPIMTYENLSRAIRFARTAGYFADLPKDSNYPKKLCFKFGPKAFGWEEEQPTQWPPSRQYRRAISETPNENFHCGPAAAAIQSSLHLQGSPQHGAGVPLYTNTTPVVEHRATAMPIAAQGSPKEGSGVGDGSGHEHHGYPVTSGVEHDSAQLISRGTLGEGRVPEIHASIHLPAVHQSSETGEGVTRNPGHDQPMQDLSSQGESHLGPRERAQNYTVSTMSSGQTMQTAESPSGSNYKSNNYLSNSPQGQGQFSQGLYLQGHGHYSHRLGPQFQDQSHYHEDQYQQGQVDGDHNFQGHTHDEGHSQVLNMSTQERTSKSPCVTENISVALNLASSSRSPVRNSTHFNTNPHQAEDQGCDDSVQKRNSPENTSQLDSTEKMEDSQHGSSLSLDNAESLSKLRFDAQTSTDPLPIFRIKKEVDP